MFFITTYGTSLHVYEKSSSYTPLNVCAAPQFRNSEVGLHVLCMLGRNATSQKDID